MHWFDSEIVHAHFAFILYVYFIHCYTGNNRIRHDDPGLFGAGNKQKIAR